MSLADGCASLKGARTWFFETLRFDFPGRLTIRLAEGIAGEQRMVQMGDAEVGPYTSVLTTPASRVIEIVFDDVWRYDTSREGRERAPEGANIHYADCLAELPSPEFDHLWSDPQMASDREEYGLRRWFVWSEDFVVYVVNSGEPGVAITGDKPNIDFKRSEIFYA